MWLFTKHGFYSAVCARQGDGSHGQPVDPDRIMVRARVRDHLEALKERFSDLLADSEIPAFFKTAIFAMVMGGIILSLSVIREKWFTHRKDPYKEIQR